jgi:hypothetical protein
MGAGAQFAPYACCAPTVPRAFQPNAGSHVGWALPTISFKVAQASRLGAQAEGRRYL